MKDYNLLLDAGTDFLHDTAESAEELTMFLKIVIVLTVVLPLLALYIRYNKKQTLSNNFKSLGNMTGMHKDDIIKRVGAPNSISAIYGGQLLQWFTTGYRIAIKFDSSGLFAGIQSEYAS